MTQFPVYHLFVKFTINKSYLCEFGCELSSGFAQQLSNHIFHIWKVSHLKNKKFMRNYI